jgi:hypothetical protein
MSEQEDFMNAIASLRTDSASALQRDIGFHPALSALRNSAWFGAFPQNALASLDECLAVFVQRQATGSS